MSVLFAVHFCGSNMFFGMFFGMFSKGRICGLFSAVTLVVFYGQLCFAGNTPQVPSAAGPSSVAIKETTVDRFLRKMPLRKKLGQMFMIGFQGTELSDGLGTTIQQIAPGGLVIFGRNILTAQQIAQLLADSQRASYRASGLPLLISTDQEGGDVIRIKTPTPLPSELALGKAANQATSEVAGEATGQLLRTLGFNMNLSPVLDVADANELGFIGTRAFGSDPDLVARLGVSFSKGLLRSGILPTAKHFPGHGAVIEDSHLKTPQRMCTLDELFAKDLLPFLAMQNSFANQWAVMLGNVAFPNIDSSGASAMTSKPIVTELLRERMGFNGLVITDDIQMGSTGASREIRERVVRAIEAGADVIVVAWNKRLQREFIDTLEQAVKKGRLSIARIDQSLRRIIAAKKLVARKLQPLPSRRELQLALSNPDFEKIATATVDARLNRPLDASEQAFKDETAGKDILVFSANQRFSASFKRGLKSAAHVRIFSLDTNRPYDVNRIMLANPRAVGVFYVSGYRAARVATKISREAASRMLAVTVEAQSALTNAADFCLVADVYYRHPELGQMVADHYFNADTHLLRAPSSAVSLVRPEVSAESPKE